MMHDIDEWCKAAEPVVRLELSMLGVVVPEGTHLGWYNRGHIVQYFSAAKWQSNLLMQLPEDINLGYLQ